MGKVAHVRHWLQPHGLEELVSFLEHDLWRPSLVLHGLGDVDVRLIRVGAKDGGNVVPALGPHVAHDVGGDGAVGRDNAGAVPKVEGNLTGVNVQLPREQYL